MCTSTYTHTHTQTLACENTLAYRWTLRRCRRLSRCLCHQNRVTIRREPSRARARATPTATRCWIKNRLALRLTVGEFAFVLHFFTFLFLFFIDCFFLFSALHSLAAMEWSDGNNNRNHNNKMSTTPTTSLLFTLKSLLLLPVHFLVFYPSFVHS